LPRYLAEVRHDLFMRFSDQLVFSDDRLQCFAVAGDPGRIRFRQKIQFLIQKNGRRHVLRMGQQSQRVLEHLHLIGI
jgi:hypothetical protein